MADMPFDMLEHVKTSNGQAGNDYINGTFQNYIDEVREYLHDAGIPENVSGTRRCAGLVARGVSDLWNLGAGDADFSPYFIKRASQLALKLEAEKHEQT